MTQILNIPSCRFFPHWDSQCTKQVIGLIEMINYISRINPTSYHWIEIGSYIGESSTIFLGFDIVKKLECVELNHNFANALRIKHKDYIASNRCLIHNRSSKDFAESINDISVDVVYIDAEHTYQSVNMELNAYFPKIRYGGFLCGHDYTRVAWPGVCDAVDEFIENNRLGPLKLFRDNSWVLQKLS